MIVAAFPALYLLRRTRYYQPFFMTGSVVLALVSVGWMIERVFETELEVNDLVDPIVELPTGAIILAVFTAIAAVLYRRESEAGRLLAVGAGSPAGDESEQDLAASVG